jgi:hypothetical protein
LLRNSRCGLYWLRADQRRAGEAANRDANPAAQSEISALNVNVIKIAAKISTLFISISFPENSF